jgi:hypothetical protein
MLIDNMLIPSLSMGRQAEDGRRTEGNYFSCFLTASYADCILHYAYLESAIPKRYGRYHLVLNNAATLYTQCSAEELARRKVEAETRARLEGLDLAQALSGHLPSFSLVSSGI